MRSSQRAFGVLFAIGIAATAGPSVNYVNIVLNSITRWIILLLLFTLTILSRKPLVGLRGATRTLCIALFLFAVSSTLWSTVPQLSGVKSLTYVLAAITFSAAGAIWVRYSELNSALDVFWPLTALALFAGLGGGISSDGMIQMNDSISIYRGLTFNSNFLGMILLGSLPLPLWRMSQPAASALQRAVYSILLAVILILLLLTVSRASILGAAIVIFFYSLGNGAGRFTLLAMAATIAGFSLIVFFPALYDVVLLKYVYKGANLDSTILASRESTWASSYDGAVHGGFLGLGYGVSYGYDDYTLALDSWNYGREKANVFLAIVEEIGLVGLFLYIALIFTVLINAFSAVGKIAEKGKRLLLLVLAGYVIALTTHAQFEAWMFSPGGALTPSFWAAIGMITALTSHIAAKRRSQRPHIAALGGV